MRAVIQRVKAASVIVAEKKISAIGPGLLIFLGILKGDGEKDLDYLLMSTIVWNKNQTGNRAAWGSYMSPSSPSFPCPYEYIIIFAKDSKKKIGDKDKITISKENFIKNAWGVWAFAPEVKQKKYGLSAMFPKELPKRCIEMLSYKDDVVFDPFSGMGTTCFMAKSLKRKYIGFELSVDYCKKSRERIAND